MYDLRRLRAFHAVAERRSFSEAALALGYAQSVVSHHVAGLEQEFGLTLVDRTHRPVALTEAGERLREHAADVLGRVATAEEEMRALAGLEAGTVRVGAFMTACTSFVPAALRAFEAEHPGVKIELEQHEPSEAVRRLRGGELDIAVVYRSFWAPETPDDGLDRQLLADDPYRFVLPAGHRLARRRHITLADLAGERFTAPPAPGRYRDMLDRLCQEAGFEVDVAYSVADVTVGRAFIAAGMCVGLLPALATPEPHTGVVLKPAQGIVPGRSIHAVTLPGRRAPAIPAMTSALADAAAERLQPAASTIS